MTIEDDKTFTAPWQMQMTLYRRTGADAQIQQFKCVEVVEELMYGSLRKGVHKGADHDVQQLFLSLIKEVYETYRLSYFPRSVFALGLRR